MRVEWKHIARDHVWKESVCRQLKHIKIAEDRDNYTLTPGVTCICDGERCARRGLTTSQQLTAKELSCRVAFNDEEYLTTSL